MIALRQLRKTFHARKKSVSALDDIDLDIRDGEFFALVGFSGSGKTTLIRCIAGLEKPDSGEIRIGSRIVYSARPPMFVPPSNRGVGMVFQSYALWPHLTVFENVALPLRFGKEKHTQVEIRKRVSAVLDLVRLHDVETRPVPFLSGGQQQRVALARALATQPKVLLADEPLSNLDAPLREVIGNDIYDLTRRMGITVIYVTHDQAEAMSLADTMAILREGKILQVGCPSSLYDSPASRYVGEFLGKMNQVPGKVGPDRILSTEVGPLTYPNNSCFAHGQVVVAIRPEDVEVSLQASMLENEFCGEIVRNSYQGDMTVYHLLSQGIQIQSKVRTADARFAPGIRVFIRFPAGKLKMFETV